MRIDEHSDQVEASRLHWWPAAVVWLTAWLAMFVLDAHLDLANLALMLVLASALAALWSSPLTSMLACALSVLAFNFSFVPPRGTFTVDFRQHALLLATMLAVGWIVTLLMARQRQLAVNARTHASRAEQLRALGEALRDADDPRARAPILLDSLARLTGTRATLLMLPLAPAAPADAAGSIVLGDPGEDEKAGLWISASQCQAMGPGTGRHEEQAAWYLPLRGRSSSFGAALVPVPTHPSDTGQVREHAQALCDQMGAALERSAALHAATAARDAARSQALRNTLLAAISHDHRTPLATILGAASSLHDQDARLSPEQRRRLAATIVDEATQLARSTENTLQLARLDTPGVVLHRDWESAEEIVGTVLRRSRQRDAAHLVRASVEQGLPLLSCDAVLLVQLLENLVDNALKYGGSSAPVEIVARRTTDGVLIAVRDRGPGVPPEWRSRIFDTFQRIGSAKERGDMDAPAGRGAGVGLAVCRAIARAHGGELRFRARSHGGSSFELLLPVRTPPATVDEAAARESPP